MIWFFAIGPGLVIGNDIFGMPNAGYDGWYMKIPSLWGYQLICWIIGIGLLWFLANKMDHSTLPTKPIQPGDLFEDVEGNVNYTENVGSSYGWILILIGLAILSIVFYIYVV